MFEVAQYAPLIHTRISEVRGLRELPDSTKDLILPLFVLRPWPRAKTLKVAFERITEAIGGRQFAVDLECEFPKAEPENDAQIEFDELRNPHNSFAAYYKKIDQIEGAIPVLQLTGDLAELPAQLDQMQKIGRGGFARITRKNFQYIEQVAAAVSNLPPDQFSIFVDAGWQRDILQQSAWALSMAQHFFDQSPDRAIVVCGSSFPIDFAKINGSSTFSINERLLFNHVRNNLNANLVYGDWASTRPPSYDDAIRRTVPRVDIAPSTEWPVYRAQKVEKLDQNDEPILAWESYQEVAERLISSHYWGNVPPIWGRYTIECTANDLSNSIKSPMVAAAVRVNLHMHVQAHFNTPELLGHTDDRYVD